MPEALTESFCERCGTRYDFKAPTRLNPLRRGRGLVTGLKNYIMSQDALSDSVGDAMRSEADAVAVVQLEAFHDAFNFCIDCRQYTCTNCWNDGAGRCRSCAPVPGTDDLIERFEATFAAQHPDANGSAPADAVSLNGDATGQRLGIDAWPSTDLSNGNGHAGLAELGDAAALTPTASDEVATPSIEAVAADEAPAPEAAAGQLEPIAAIAEVETPPVIAEDVSSEVELPTLAAEVHAITEPEPLRVADEPPTAAAESAEPELLVVDHPQLRVVAWEPDQPYELLEPEQVLAEIEATDAVEAVEATEAVDEPPRIAGDDGFELDAAPAAASASEPAEPEPMPAPERRTLRPIGDTILHLPRPSERPAQAPAAAADDDPLAVARRAQMELLGLDDPGQGVVRPERPRVMPYRSSGAAMPPGELAARAAEANGSSGFWDASSREVADAITAIGVQNCGSCGLSLSASARFCRRCGGRQAQPA